MIFFPFILRNKLLIHYGSVYIFIACCWTFVDIDIISANRQTRCKSFVNALSMKEKAFIECYAFKCKRCRVCFSKNLMVSHCFGAATHILSILVSAEAFFRIIRISNGCFANLYCKFRILTFLKHNSGCLGFFPFSMGLNEVKMNCQNPSFVGKMFQTEKFMFFNRSRVSLTGIIFGKKRVWGFNRCCLKAVGFFLLKQF